MKQKNFVNQIFCEDCIKTMEKMINNEFKVDLILTSPPYNTVRDGGITSEKSRKDGYGRYDEYYDTKTETEYINWTLQLFGLFNKVLEKNGVVIYNLSYGRENTELMWRVVYNIIENSPFTIGDNIIWKKKTAMPHPASFNKLTRICEYIYIFCRKTEFETYNQNLKVNKIGKNGQKYYIPQQNWIEADNNDGANKLNKATFSTELVSQLLDMYVIDKNSIVYDCFMGTGTTANACRSKGINYVGSEISYPQVEYSKNRLKSVQSRLM